jgi:hypothetical protein
MMGMAGKTSSVIGVYQGIALVYVIMMVFSFAIGLWLLASNGEGPGLRWQSLGIPCRTHVRSGKSQLPSDDLTSDALPRPSPPASAPAGFSVFVTLGVVATVGGYVIASLIHSRLVVVLFTYLQYSLSIPIWVNIFSTFSVSECPQRMHMRRWHGGGA